MICWPGKTPVTTLQLFKVMCAFLIQSTIEHMLTKIYRFLFSHREAGFTQPAVCATPEYTETCSLKFYLSSYSSCMLYLNPFILTWLHMIKYIQDVAFIHHKIKDSSEHEETS